MDKQSKKELLVVVQRQNEQLKRYEARLRDVVQAYKGLQKEKVALEKSLKVLSPSRKSVVESESSREGDKSPLVVKQTRDEDTPTRHGEETEGHDSSDDSTDKTGLSCADPEMQQRKPDDDSPSQTNLQAQVETLRETLKTVMEQKSKMESSFQADRKKYLQELEKKEETFADERDDFSKMKENMQQEIQDLRNRTRQEQQAREVEQNDHVMMLREMQLVVSKERSSKEELLSKLDQLNELLATKEAQSSNVSPQEPNESKENTTVGSNEAEEVDENLESSPSPTLLQLQQELVKMKAQLEKDILSEQLRANEAEAKASMIAKAEEQRVADLEAKLSELSDVVGKYERLRSHDQLEIQKLKERLYFLNTRDKDDGIQDNRNVENEPNLSNQGNVKDVFLKVKELLRSRFQNNEDILESDETGFSKAELECILKNDPAHKACQEELRQLKDEFERYKSKTQTIRKARLESETECNNESTGKLKSQISRLQSSVESLQKELDAKENEYCLSRENNLNELTELRVKHNVELENERTVYSAKLQELESQVRNQRSRTLALIAEKDCEIERLKGKLAECSPSSSIDTRKKSGVCKRSNSSDTAVNELLSQSSPSSLVHYVQEQAFCEAELELLRKQRSELEDTIRDVHHREEQSAEQIQLLKEEIRKLERNRSRESANLEYVKNVILRYLLTDSDSVRQQMVAAISTILEFSPQELSRVKRRSKGWWLR